MKNCWLPLLFLLCLKATPQGVKLPVGAITDSVSVPGSPGESFAIYLPEKYDGVKAFPVVFVFDPTARGKTGVTPFVPAAEKYGYILVGSNNTRNGPYDANFQVAQHLFSHCLNTYRVIPQRIYTAGFSGGARLAATIAILSGVIEGVIGCGAGFAGFPYLPTSRDKYSYAGVVGNLDMNYGEVTGLPGWLEGTGIPVEIFTFQGNHQWPPGAVLVKAFDWLQLEAMRKGLAPKDDAAIDRAFALHYRDASRTEADGDLLGAVTQYEQALRVFGPWLQIDSLLARVENLKKTGLYRKEAREYQQGRQLEDTLSSQYQMRFNQELETAGSVANFKWWERRIEELERDYLQSNQPQRKNIGQRLQSMLMAIAMESFDAQVSAQQPDKALYCAGLLEVFDPDNAYFQYKIALGLARLQQPQPASDHLIKALEYGWTDKKALESSKELAPLLQREPLKSLVDNL